MPLVLRDLPRLSASPSDPLPSLSASGVSWRSCRPGLVAVFVELKNESNQPCPARPLKIEAGPLGAFVPSHPIAHFPAPRLAPREEGRAWVFLPRPLLDAITRVPFANPIPDGVAGGEWAGNVHVALDGAPHGAVEAHRALGMRLRAGSEANFFLLIPPDSPRERFLTRVHCSETGWTTRLFRRDAAGRASLSVQAPAQAGRQVRIVVDVRRVSDGRTVPIEFGIESV